MVVVTLAGVGFSGAWPQHCGLGSRLFQPLQLTLVFPPADAKPCLKREEKLPPEPRGGPRPACTACGRFFLDQEALISHVLHVHLSEQTLPFPQCGGFLGGPGSPAALQSTHVQEPVFICIDCKGSFVYEEQEAGRIHAQLALGKLFKCFDCSCKVALMVDQKPDALLSSDLFGQPDAMYYR